MIQPRRTATLLIIHSSLVQLHNVIIKMATWKYYMAYLERGMTGVNGN